MSLSQRINSIQTKVYWIDSSGTVDLSGDRRVLDVTLGVTTADMEAGNDLATAKKALLEDNSASLTMFSAGTAGTASMARIKAGSEGTLVWGELGTAAGLPKGGFPVVVTSFKQPMQFPDPIEISVEFAGQGALTYDPREDVWP